MRPQADTALAIAGGQMKESICYAFSSYLRIFDER